MMADANCYQCLLGKLIYLTITHPIITYALIVFSWFVQESRVVYWEGALQVILYIKCALSKGLIYQGHDHLLIEAYMLGTKWWRTTPVATKTRYHGAGGALLRARIYPLIFISLFLYYELFDPHVFKRVLAYFPLPFRLSGGFFPFRDPIREALSFVNLCFL